MASLSCRGSSPTEVPPSFIIYVYGPLSCRGSSPNKVPPSSIIWPIAILPYHLHPSHHELMLTNLSFQIALAPPGTQACTLDIAKFHRTCPVLPDHKPWLVVQGRPNNFYIDHTHPFGASCASSNAGMIANALVDIWMAQDIKPGHSMMVNTITCMTGLKLFAASRILGFPGILRKALPFSRMSLHSLDCHGTSRAIAFLFQRTSCSSSYAMSLTSFLLSSASNVTFAIFRGFTALSATFPLSTLKVVPACPPCQISLPLSEMMSIWPASLRVQLSPISGGGPKLSKILPSSATSPHVVLHLTLVFLLMQALRGALVSYSAENGFHGNSHHRGRSQAETFVG